MSNLSHARDEIVSIYFVIKDSALFYASDNRRASGARPEANLFADGIVCCIRCL
jgi:hypothetical protein